MQNLISEWKEKIAQELFMAELLIKAANGEDDAYRELLKREKEEEKTPARVPGRGLGAAEVA